MLERSVKFFFTFANIIFLCLIVLNSSAHAEEKIKIGVPLTLSGEGAGWGTDTKDALEFANKNVFGSKYEFIYEDDKCDPKEAVLVTKRLINIHKVKYVIGYVCSGALLASAPVLEKAKIPTMVLAASSPKIANAGDYIFRSYPSDGEAARVLFESLNDKFKSIAIFSSQSEYTQGFKDAFIAAGKGKKINYTTEDYIPDKTDFRSEILLLKSKSPEILFINAQFETSMVNILKQIKELKWEIPLISAYWPGTPTLLGAHPDLVEGIVYVDTDTNDRVLNSEGKKLFQDFISAVKIKTLESIFPSVINGFTALDKAISSGEDIRQYLYKNKFNSVTGEYYFDQDGEIKGPSFVIKKIVNGKAQIVN